MIFQVPDPAKLSQPVATDTPIAAIARDIIAVLGATGLLWTILWTLARSWTRDRLYSLLESKPETRAKFVLDVIGKETHRNEIGTIVLDTVAGPHHRDRFRAIIGELYEIELEQLREMRKSVHDLGMRTGELVVSVSTMEDLTRTFAASQMESAKTTAVLAESVRSMNESMTYLRDEMGKLGDKIDRTQEIVISSMPSRQQGRRRPPRQ